jgi:hypothetical protein
MAQSIRQRAIAFAKSEIMRSTDWQDVQDALSNHDEFAAWLGDDAAEYQSIIREAEEALGAKIPYGYSN